MQELLHNPRTAKVSETEPTSQHQHCYDAVCNPLQDLSDLLAGSHLDPNSIDSSGGAPLHSLARRDCKSSQEAQDLLYTFLTESDADLNLPDGIGNTVLHIAVEVLVWEGGGGNFDSWVGLYMRGKGQVEVGEGWGCERR